LLHDVCDTDLWRGSNSFRRPDLVAHCSDLRRSSVVVRDFFHHLSDNRRAKPVEFRGKNHCRHRDCECDWRSGLPFREEASARLTTIICNPTQIFGQAVVDLREDDFWNLVWMKRTQFFLKCWASILAQLEEHECFISRFNFVFPAVNGFDAW